MEVRLLQLLVPPLHHLLLQASGLCQLVTIKLLSVSMVNSVLEPEPKLIVQKLIIAPWEQLLSKLWLLVLNRKRPNFGTRNNVHQDLSVLLEQRPHKLVKVTSAKKDRLQILQHNAQLVTTALKVLSVQRCILVLLILGLRLLQNVHLTRNVAQLQHVWPESIASKDFKLVAQRECSAQLSEQPI